MTYLCGWMFWLNGCVACMYLVPMDAKKILLKLWDWNYRSLLAAIEMLENKPGSSAGGKSYPNHWAISAASWCYVFWGVIYLWVQLHACIHCVCVCDIPSFRKWWWLVLNVYQKQLRLRRALQLRSFLDHIGLWAYLWAVVLLTEMWRPTLNMGSTIPWTEP